MCRGMQTPSLNNVFIKKRFLFLVKHDVFKTSPNVRKLKNILRIQVGARNLKTFEIFTMK